MPASSAELLAFRRAVRAAISSTPAPSAPPTPAEKSKGNTAKHPLVVQDSAGVGRTGVYIAIDRLLEELDNGSKNSLDVRAVVADMRNARNMMVCNQLWP